MCQLNTCIRLCAGPLILLVALKLVSSSANATDDIEFSITSKLKSEAFSQIDITSNAEPGFRDDAVQLASYAPASQSSRSAYCSPGARVGYDGGFVIASQRELQLNADNQPFLLRINGWGQLRLTNLNSVDPDSDLNQFQLKRGRIIFSGHAFTPDFAYYVQIDGRSSSGDDVRLLDYFLTYDLGHHAWCWKRKTLQIKAGQYKMPFTFARYVSGREFEFTDRSMASIFFDVNRSLGCGIYGEQGDCNTPWSWELAFFNGLVTGGSETGSSGDLDNNFGYSGRVFLFPLGDWGEGELADFDWHDDLAIRAGAAFATSTIDRQGLTEFQIVRVVDSGSTLASLLPPTADRYTVGLYAVDVAAKWRGWSATFEYYFRGIGDFQSPVAPDLYDHGYWLQVGKFVVPGKVQLLSRWSRVVGDSGTLGVQNQSSDEVAGGIVWYIHGQHAKLTFDFTHLNGAPINSPALDISPGDAGWLMRSQLQFAF